MSHHDWETGAVIVAGLLVATLAALVASYQIVAGMFSP